MPAGRTCPGKTELCHRLCYARSGRFRFRDVKVAHESSLKRSHESGFVSWMVLTIRDVCALAVRVHTGGDFYNARYVRQWISIAKRCPNTCFYAYTRSWRDPRVAPALRQLAALPNFALWYSCDRETGEPPRNPGVERAWMAENDKDLPPFPVDLVFRNNIERPRRTLGGYPICAYDQNVAQTSRVTCSHCQRCWKGNVLYQAKPEAQAEDHGEATLRSLRGRRLVGAT